MGNKKLFSLVFFILAGWLAAGCNPETPVTVVPTGLDPVYTQAAQTIALQLTLKAGEEAVRRLTEIARTPTPLPATPVETQRPTDTPQPPTATPTLPPPTDTPQTTLCNWAKYVGDVTIEPGAVLQPGARFTKIWRVQNIGACAWTRDYRLVYFDGDRLGVTEGVLIGELVQPGETVDLAVDLVAPEIEGVYSAYWMLQAPNGEYFGVGSQARESLYLQIEVRNPTEIAFSFADNICSAIWSTPQGLLDCPGAETDMASGFVLLSENPVLETARADNEPAIVTFPSDGRGGSISGIFPAFRVRRGDHFKTFIGCLYDSFDCNVVFQLNYSVEGGPFENLDTWTEVYDNHITRVNIDLSFLAGKSVEFMLAVLNNGGAKDDWAFWLYPVIVR